MKATFLKKSFKMFVWFLVLGFSLLPVPANTWAQTVDAETEAAISEETPLLDETFVEEDLLKAPMKSTAQQPTSPDGTPTTQAQGPASPAEGTPVTQPQEGLGIGQEGQALQPLGEGEAPTLDQQVLGTQEVPASERVATEPAFDPNKEVISMSKEELDHLQEAIAQVDDPALKAEMLSVAAQDVQFMITDSVQADNENNTPAVDIATPEGQTDALQKLDTNAPALMQGGVSQQTIAALKEAIGSGDKTKAEMLMSEMGPMGEMNRGAPGMEMVDFKDFYTGVRVEEMGIAMMKEGGFSPDQVDQFTDKAKQEMFAHHGENFDPKAMFEGAFREVFGQGAPMMDGQGQMMVRSPEMMGPNGPMDPAMMGQGPNGPNGPMGPAPGEMAFNNPGGFNFNDFMGQNPNMMGELAFMANHDNFNPQGPNGPQGFEWQGSGQFGGPGPNGPEFYGQGGPMPGFDPANMPAGFDPANMPAGFDPANMPGGWEPPPGFEPPSGFEPPPPPPEGSPPIQQANPNPPPPPPDPPGLQHHDLGDTPHVENDAHACTPPQCS